MFQIKAAFEEKLEIKTTIERARAFFSDVGNFVNLMPGVESIRQEAGGVARWLIRAEVPVLGAVRHAFPVRQTEDGPARIEWSPAAGERSRKADWTSARHRATLRAAPAATSARASCSP